MPPTVTVTTGARLHFGPLSVGVRESRAFGGVGVMVNQPGFHIRFSHHENDEIDAGNRTGRVQGCLDACRNVVPIPPCRIQVASSPPAHAGFGAGTQLALAVAAGLFQLSGQPVPPAQRLALIVGRGRRSAIGIHGFEQGGLIVDAGKSSADSIGTLACRVELPESWRFLLITPAKAKGLSGRPERAAFERLSPMASTTTDRLCRLVVTALLPAAHAADGAAFGEAMFEYGRLIGEYFAPEQGGVNACAQADTLIERLRAAGVTGIAQTSWGPTLCALVEGEERAESIGERLVGLPELQDVNLRIAAPLNRGAVVSSEAF